MAELGLTMKQRHSICFGYCCNLFEKKQSPNQDIVPMMLQYHQEVMVLLVLMKILHQQVAIVLLR